MSEKTNYTELWEKGFMEGLYKRFSDLISPLDTPLLNVIIERSNTIFENRNEISMLEIGAGSGVRTAFVLDGVADNRKVSYTGIDVSDAQREIFKESSSRFPENVTVKEYVLSPWQDYEVTKKYDLIIAQHSWYGIGGNPIYIKKLVDSIDKGGVAFVMLSGEETVSLLVWRANGDELFSAEDFEKALKVEGITFEKIREASDTYTREDFYKDGKLTSKGIDLCGYLYKKELHGDEQNVIEMICSIPDEAFRYPKFLFIIRK